MGKDDIKTCSVSCSQCQKMIPITEKKLKTLKYLKVFCSKDCKTSWAARKALGGSEIIEG